MGRREYLAKRARFYSYFSVWIESIPLDINTFVYAKKPLFLNYETLEGLFKKKKKTHFYILGLLCRASLDIYIYIYIYIFVRPYRIFNLKSFLYQKKKKKKKLKRFYKRSVTMLLSTI